MYRNYMKVLQTQYLFFMKTTPDKINTLNSAKVVVALSSIILYKFHAWSTGKFYLQAPFSNTKLLAMKNENNDEEKLSSSSTEMLLVHSGTWKMYWLNWNFARLEKFLIYGFKLDLISVNYKFLVVCSYRSKWVVSKEDEMLINI